MNTLIKMMAVSGVIVTSSMPVFAQTEAADPMTMTCADYSAMDAAGMMTSTQHIDMLMAMTEEERTAAMAMTAEEKATKMSEMNNAQAAMTDDEKTAAKGATETSMAKLMEACKAMPDGTVMDAAKAKM